MRSFIAIPIPKAVKEYIVGVQEFLRQRGVKAKWVRPESSHLTLLFLGEQDQSSLARLSQKFGLGGC
ncbi:MAG: 2'-5' RNA ligase family protein [Lentisphaeria bacterium]